MIRLATIGTNFITDWLMEGILELDEIQLTAVYSRNLEKGKQFAAKYNVEKVYDNYEEMAKDPEIDAVYVASPTYMHYAHSITMINYGKHVLCEKPVCSNREELDILIKAAKEQGVVFMEAMKNVHSPGFHAMMDNLYKIGTVRRATIQYCQYSSRYDNYKRGIIENAFKPELSNGALMDIGVYVVACMIRLFGAPVSIKASGIKLSNGVDGAGTILMEYPDMIGEAIYSKITDSAMPSQIQGEDASMLVQEIENIKDLRIVRKGVVQSIHFEQSDNILNYETQEFIKMIKTGMGWEKSREITLETMKVLDEARRQLHIVFPADEKSQEKKKQKKTAKEEE